jgi:hypothetical protein
VTNGNFWSVGSTNGTGGNGIAQTLKPLTGDLLGTTITNYAPAPNKLVINTWAGQDLGANVAGFNNNEAVGHLVLDALGPNSAFQFNGTGASNGLYVDRLDLVDYASYTNHSLSGDIPALIFNTNLNLVIYYASAFANGVSVADKLNNKNGGHLRWVPQYVGHFSSVSFIYPDGTTNVLNASLLQSTTIDSDGDGIANAFDTSPIFLSSEVNLTQTLTNLPPLTELIQWHSVPSATNYVFYSTSPAGPFTLLLTNFNSPSLVPPSGGWPITNTVADPAVGPSRYYRVRVDQNSTVEFGP